MMKIGIFGGSFNPIHLEHINIAKEGVKELKLDKLFIIPTNISPHKINSGEMTSGENRLKMLELAFKNDKKIQVCDYEIKKEGISYTYLTIEHFKKTFLNSELYFLMGSDMLENFPTWKNPNFIVENAKIVLVERKGDNLKSQKLIENFKNLYGKSVKVLKVFGTTYSSTEIRIRKKLGLSLDGLVLPEIEKYIYENNLYEANEYYSYIRENIPLKRREHICGVILTSLKLAKQFDIDKNKVELAALLHDIAKYVVVEDKKKYNIPENCPKEVYHQYVGEYLAKNLLKIQDEEVLNAIKYHTSGRPNMSLLEKIIYTADIIEPTRKFIGVEELRKAVFEDFEEGFLTCVKEILEFLKRDGGEIYPLSIEACEYYTKQKEIK